MVGHDDTGATVSDVPTPHALGLRKFTPGVKDERGNTIDAWGDPVTIRVHGVAPGAMDEPGSAARDLSLIAWTVYAPAGHGIAARDLIVLNGREYRINGEPRDWTMGPWDMPIAGSVIELTRAEG